MIRWLRPYMARRNVLFSIWLFGAGLGGWIAWLSDPVNLLTALEVAFGIGMVIFVHELGHFVVAKMCGVKCEKFYLGFDAWGLKLFKFQWGETEYGIGAIPLGGYVKMLGQEDNPARAAEEAERAKVPGETVDGEPVVVLDPRSYMAKSVPQRMAIISAGVIMNVIFAFVVATAAYMIGVEYVPCLVGQAVPGGAAWTAGLRSGDDVIRLNQVKDPRFEDLLQQVTLGNLEDGVLFVVKRPGEPEPLEFRVRPDVSKIKEFLTPKVGITPEYSLLLKGKTIVRPGSPAAEAKPSFASGDLIKEVDGAPVASYTDFEYQLATHADQTVRVTVERKANEAEDNEAVEQVVIDVPPRGRKDVGFEWGWGPVTAVQAGSPAEAAGIKPGDTLVSFEGEDLGDPITFPDRVRRRSGETVRLSLVRDSDTIEKVLTLRQARWVEEPMIPGTPLSAPELGLAYQVSNHIASVEPGSQAADLKLGQGESTAVASAKLVLPAPKIEEGREPTDEELALARQAEAYAKLKFNLTAEGGDIPYLMHLLDGAPLGTRVRLTLAGEREVEILPTLSDEAFIVDRGVMPMPVLRPRKAKSFGEALALGSSTAADWLTQVFKFLRMIGTQVSVKALGGPIAIISTAGHAAELGVSDFLLFLGLLSANLAVLNFLPIPLLDGGHMVFLILEGIRGKPVSERVVIAFHYAGMIFLLGLMLFVFALDLNFIPRTG